MKTKLLILLVGASVLLNCTSNKENKTLSGLDKAKFQTVINGDSTGLYVLKNA